MNSATININSRYYCAPSKVAQLQIAFDVIDRARELQFLDGVVFSNGSEAECREWVLRNCEEPVEHTKGPWKRKGAGLTSVVDSDGRVISDWSTDILSPERQANADLITAAPALLALLEQYHSSMPTKESGKLICEAKGWAI